MGGTSALFDVGGLRAYRVPETDARGAFGSYLSLRKCTSKNWPTGRCTKFTLDKHCTFLDFRASGETRPGHDRTSPERHRTRHERGSIADASYSC